MFNLKKKMKNKKGFTLAELLIVVAIIAVLVAVSIPIFTAQLNKAKAATDAANIRSGYAQIVTKVLDSDTAPADNTNYYLKADGTIGDGAATASTTGAYLTKGASANASGLTAIGGTATPTWTAGKAIVYTYHADGTVTFAAA